VSAERTMSPEVDTRLKELPIHFAEVDIDTLTDEVRRMFEQRADLPGVCLVENGEHLGIISRQMLFQNMSKQFYPELYLFRPIMRFFRKTCQDVLRLKSNCSIHRAVELALSRPLRIAYEPILVEFDDGRCGLLDIHTLLMAQSQAMKLAKAIHEQKEAAEAANLAKTEFLANISHELRTPLHGISSYSRFGIEEAMSADRDELLDYFSRIDQCSETLLRLVNDLLDLAKLESGRIEFAFETVALA